MPNHFQPTIPVAEPVSYSLYYYQPFLVFAFIDTIIIAIVGDITIFHRIAFHLPLMPIVAGVSYEINKTYRSQG